MIKVKQFEFSFFGVNTYLVIDEATKETAVIDPAMDKAAEQQEFDSYVKEHGLKITQIINTHLHLDHCFGIDYVKNAYGVPVKAHSADAVLGKIVPQQYQMFGLKPKGNPVEIDVSLKDGDTIDIGESQLKVIHVPGHTQGGIALYSPEDKLLFSGDTIFHASVGRTDLPGGNQAQLINSIRRRIFTLPEDVTILPGHNGPTTVGYEKINNPFA